MYLELKRLLYVLITLLDLLEKIKAIVLFCFQ